jgi:hypothetical protein
VAKAVIDVGSVPERYQMAQRRMIHFSSYLTDAAKSRIARGNRCIVRGTQRTGFLDGRMKGRTFGMFGPPPRRKRKVIIADKVCAYVYGLVGVFDEPGPGGMG